MNDKRLPVFTTHEQHLLTNFPEKFVAEARFREVSAEDMARLRRGEVTRDELRRAPRVEF